jgi:hypothetical protein
MTKKISTPQTGMQPSPSEKPEHIYIEWTWGQDDDFETELRKPDFVDMVYSLAGIAYFSILLAALLIPWLLLVRVGFGSFFGVSLLPFIAALYLFVRLLPPPFRATKVMRRAFMRKLRNKKLQRAGLNSGAVLDTVLGSDGQTLEIVVNGEWLDQSYEKRVKDAQRYWRLWVRVYQPYNAHEAQILLRDRNGKQVGGCKPHNGSQVWVEKN